MDRLYSGCPDALEALLFSGPLSDQILRHMYQKVYLCLYRGKQENKTDLKLM